MINITTFVYTPHILNDQHNTNSSQRDKPQHLLNDKEPAESTFEPLYYIRPP